LHYIADIRKAEPIWITVIHIAAKVSSRIASTKGVIRSS